MSITKQTKQLGGWCGVFLFLDIKYLGNCVEYLAPQNCLFKAKVKVQNLVKLGAFKGGIYTMCR